MGILKKDKKKKSVENKKTDKDETTKKNEATAEGKEPSDTELSPEMVTEAVSKSNKFTHRLMLISVFFIVLFVSGYGVMAWQTSARVSVLNQNVQATLDSVNALNEIIAKLADNQSEFKNQQSLLLKTVEKSETNVAEMQNKIPDAAAKQVSLETDKVVVQIQDLERALKVQGKDIGLVSNVVANLGSQLTVFEDRLENVQKLSSDVEALIILEKAKYLSVLGRQADLQEKQSGPAPLKVPRDPNLVFYSIQSSD
jgi:hypothetical protein